MRRTTLALALGLPFLVLGMRAQTIVVTPTNLAFTYTADSGALPPAQTFQVSSSGGSLPFSVGIGTGNFGNDPVYLSVNPSTGNTPATVTVAVTSTVLPYGYGQYTNYIGVGNPNTPTAPGGQVYVALDVLLPPPPSVTTILSASTLQPGISPGAIVSIFGHHIGPIIPAYGEVSAPFDGSELYYSSTAGNSEVTFNGVAAPLLFANNDQINAVVPYEIARQSSVQMVVAHDFVSAPAIAVPVLDTSPGIFTDTENGSGQGAILNQNGTLNSVANPAAAGSTVQIYASGAGVWNPNVVDGLELPGSGPLPIPVAAVSVTIGGQTAKLTYAGVAPGLISGVLQVNAVVPSGLKSGPQPVLLTVGKNSNSQQQVTVAVQ